MVSGVRALLPVVLLLLTAFGALAQAPGEGEAEPPSPSTTVDAPADVQLEADGNAQPDPTGQCSTADIEKVTIVEKDDKSLLFSIEMASMDDTSAAWHTIGFSFETISFQIARGGRDFSKYYLNYFEPGVNAWRPINRELVVQRETAAGKATYTVPREIINNENQVQIQYGDAIVNVTAHGWKYMGGLFYGNAQVMCHDRAPDGNVAGTPYTLRLGRVGEGGASLLSTDPVRVSNGEATTIIYKVQLRNDGDVEQQYEITVQHAREGWTVRVPPVLRVGAHGAVTFAVMVSMPMNHDHGTKALFHLHAHSTKDPQNIWSMLELGVWWTETPQPAGHHPLFWFHSKEVYSQWDPSGGSLSQQLQQTTGQRSLWFNPAIEDFDPETKDEHEKGVPGPTSQYVQNVTRRGPGTPSVEQPTPDKWRTIWWAPLTPSLLIGLDFNLEGKANFSLSVKHDMQVSHSILTATMFYCNPANSKGAVVDCKTYSAAYWEPIMEGQSTDMPAPRDTEVAYTFQLTPLKLADILRYVKGSNIGIRLTLTTDVPPNGVFVAPQPRLMLPKTAAARGHLELPLFEYHDPIDPMFDKLSQLSLASDLVDKKVNPGETSQFHFTLKNGATTDELVELELMGENVAWAEILGEKVIEVAAGASIPITVAVAPPENVGHEKRAVLMLAASSVRDPSIMTVMRLQATTDAYAEIADEPIKDLNAGAKKKTPAVELPLVALSLLGLAYAFRRK